MNKVKLSSFIADKDRSGISDKPLAKGTTQLSVGMYGNNVMCSFKRTISVNDKMSEDLMLDLTYDQFVAYSSGPVMNGEIRGHRFFAITGMKMDVRFKYMVIKFILFSFPSVKLSSKLAFCERVTIFEPYSNILLFHMCFIN